MKTTPEEYQRLLESYLGRASWVTWAYHNLGCFNQTLKACAQNGVSIDEAFVIACEVLTKAMILQNEVFKTSKTKFASK